MLSIWNNECDRTTYVNRLDAKMREVQAQGGTWTLVSRTES